MSFVNELKNRDNITANLYPDFQNATLRLELSNICNHKCIFCPNSKLKRRKVEMPQELVHRLLQEGAQLGIKEVGFFMNGEPFVSARLEEHIQYAKELGYRVFITTNGALATQERIRKVVDLGLDSVKFSVNGGSRESFLKVHGRDDYETVIQNLAYFRQYRDETKAKTRILASCVVTKYITDEIDAHYQNLAQYADDVVFYKAESFAGQMKKEVEEIQVDIDHKYVPKYSLPNALPCPELFRVICVTAEGYLTLCCSEALNYLAVLDMNEYSLKDAWHSEIMCKLRKQHIEKKVKGTLCETCIYGNEDGIEPLNHDLYENSLLR